MKSKRTKLTALALSALMAVSTISSVTWAADLFSDGSDETEVVAEDAEAFASSEEDVIVTEEAESSDEAQILTRSVSQAKSGGDIDYYEPVTVVNDEYTYTLYDSTTKKGEGVYWDESKHSYYFEYSENGVLKKVEAKDSGFSDKATCQNPPRVKVSVSIVIEDASGNPETVSGDLWYYDVDDFKKQDPSSPNTFLYDKDAHHAGVEKYLTIANTLFDKPGCESERDFVVYTECTYCHDLYNIETKTWDGTVYKDAKDANKSIEEFLELNYTLDRYKPYVRADKFSVKGHTPGTTVMTTLPPVTVNGIPYGEYDGRTTDSKPEAKYSLNTKGDFNSLSGVSDTEEKVYTLKNVSNGLYYDDLKKYYNDKANCTIINGTHSGAMDSTRDAYVYNVTFCKDCGKVVSVDKDIFHHTGSMTEASEYYMGVKNIAFFVDTNGTKWYGKIPKDKFSFVVLDNCDLDGVYDLYVTSKNFDGTDSGVPTVAQTFTEKAGHKWKSPVVSAVGVEMDDPQIVDLFKDWTYENGKYKINPKKVNDTEWGVYAKYCDTAAYYVWEQHCWNPNCRYCDSDSPKANKEGFGLSNPDLGGGQRKALPGDHDWYTENDVRPDGRPGRFVDPTKTEYDQIKDKNGEVDMEHHLEKYKDSVECKRCHTQDTMASNKPDAVVDHTFVSKPDPDATRVEADCGNPGSYERVDICVCQLKNESTRKKVTIPATDKHDFGNNPPIILWSGGKDKDNDGIGDGDGAVHIADGYVAGVSLHADIVRLCNKCGKYDSNGINTMIPGSPDGADVEIKDSSFDLDHWDNTTLVPAGKWCAKLHVTSIDPASTDPLTGIAYRCSTAHATIEVDWVGTVDGKVYELNKDTADNAVKENVPYYKTAVEYQARTSHTPGKPQKEGDRIITRCTVCGEIVSNDPDNTPSVGVPTVSAASVDFDTVNVSWTKVEGATAYRLYFRSSDEGINKWQRIRTFTGDATSYPVNGLTTGSKYRFTVRAEITQDGKTTLGDYSKKGAVAVPKLTAPEIKSVTASGKTTKVTWGRVDGASGYIVFRNSQRVGTVTKGSKLSWTDKKPVSGAKYQVRAYRTEAKKNYKSGLSEPK